MKIRTLETLRASALAARRGFTLIEVLLVIVIILMLAAALVVFVLPQQKGAEVNTTKLMLRQVESALDNYRMNVGHYPTEDEGGLGALLAKPNFENERLGEKWNGPYLRRGTKLEDPWGNQVRYEPVDQTLAEDKTGPDFKLFSLGPDGQPETEDDIQLTPEDEGNQDANTVLEQEQP